MDSLGLLRDLWSPFNPVGSLLVKISPNLSVGASIVIIQGPNVAQSIDLERLNLYTPNKCLVHGCGNTSDQGHFVGEICSPCYEFITTGKGPHSSVYRNATKELQEECDHLHKRSTELVEECRGLHRLKHKQSQLVDWLIDRLGENRSDLIGELERDVILKQELLETLSSE